MGHFRAGFENWFSLEVTIYERKSQISKTFSDGSELFEFEERDNKVNEHGKYLCLRIFNNPCPRQIRVRGAEFSCPRGVRGPRGCARIRADATSIRGPPSVTEPTRMVCVSLISKLK